MTVTGCGSVLTEQVGGALSDTIWSPAGTPAKWARGPCPTETGFVPSTEAMNWFSAPLPEITKRTTRLVAVHDAVNSTGTTSASVTVTT